MLLLGPHLQEDWRATFWMPWIGVKLAADFAAGPAAVELYAHAGDTESDFGEHQQSAPACETGIGLTARLLAWQMRLRM